MKVKQNSKCLTEREIALFVDLKSGYKGYERIVSHLAVCNDCLDKVIDVKGLLGSEGQEAPPELVERAFLKSTVEINRQLAGRLALYKKAAISLAAAASVVVISLAGLRIFNTADTEAPLKHKVAVQNKSGADAVSEKAAEARRFPKKKKSAVAGKRIYEIEIKKDEFKDQPLMYAGYLYFLLSNSSSPDRELLDKFLSVLADTSLYSENRSVLIKHGWFELFQKELSSLPEKEIDDFAEGYILSLLYHSDTRGKVSRATLEWGVRLALHASMEEIRQCMLYERSRLYGE